MKSLIIWANNNEWSDLIGDSNLRLRCFRLKFCLEIASYRRLNFGHLWTVLTQVQETTLPNSSSVRKSKDRLRLHVCLEWIVQKNLAYFLSVWCSISNQNSDAKCPNLSISLARIGMLLMQMKRCLWQTKMWT